MGENGSRTGLVVLASNPAKRAVSAKVCAAEVTELRMRRVEVWKELVMSDFEKVLIENYWAKRSYFAYGFDISSDYAPAGLIGKDKAKLTGYELVCDAGGYPTLIEKPDGVVWGVIWRNLSESTMEMLEEANGVDRGERIKLNVNVRTFGATKQGKLEHMFTFLSPKAPYSLKTHEVEAFGAVRDEMFDLNMPPEAFGRVDEILRENGCPCLRPDAKRGHVEEDFNVTHEQAEVYLRYVCENCFKTLDECTCARRPSGLVSIDREIQPHISLLNRKGYMTKFCCSGHESNGECGHVSFWRSFSVSDLEYLYQDAVKASSNAEAKPKSKAKLPSQVKIDIPGMPDSYEFFLEPRHSSIRFAPRPRVSKEVMVRDKPAMMAALLAWIEELPVCERLGLGL